MAAKVPVPFADPPWLNALPSPYYTESHRKWQRSCRSFIEENLGQHAMDWEREGAVPAETFRRFADAGFLVPSLPAPLPVAWLKKLGVHKLAGGLPVEDFDYIHNAIFTDEMARSGLAGPPASLTTGMAFGVPPLIKFGSPELQEKFLPDLLLGKKRACIAITEPGAGSDVANISTTAVKTEDGKHYLVNGTKKWITNGLWADLSTTAVRTGGPGPTGLSLLLIPLQSQPGITLRPLPTSGGTTSGTALITLEDVLVPTTNLIGAPGTGMHSLMTNFNHERLTLALGATRSARVALSSALAYSLRREAFGAALIDGQPVVRHRVAKAGAALESQAAWLEQIVFAMAGLPPGRADAEMGGVVALAKARAGMVLRECADVAVLLFGGNGYTRSGMGEIAEMIYREVPGARIPGGSEDVMLDLAVRQLVKNYRVKTRELERLHGEKSKI